MKNFQSFTATTLLTLFLCAFVLSVQIPAIGKEAIWPATVEIVAQIAAEMDEADDETAEPTSEDQTAEEQTAEEQTSEEQTTEEQSTDKPTSEAATEENTSNLTTEERVRRKILIQADREYLAGNFEAARALYQQAKDQTWLVPQQFAVLPPEPFSDEALLSPAAAVYWREAKAGIDNRRPAQTLTALRLLTSEYPAFIPGHLQYADMLRADGQIEAAGVALEAALTEYPGQSDLLLAQVETMMAGSQWLEATIASRQFVALNSDHPQAAEQRTLAAENLERFQKETREDIRGGAIANVVTGVLGYALTGSIFGPFTAANSTILLLQGENAVGSQVANQVRQRLPMLQHPEAVGYVRSIGNRLSQATGRRDLDYEFHVILDPNLNAFALPGGKIFVNAGAILDTQSEAELAGLLAHELSHAVLSHGFQIATRSNLSSSLAQYLPYGGLINNVFLSGYSRRMERQADIVGTQILAASDYAADGVYNVMVTLNEQAQASGRNVPTWISTHPNPEDRVTYLKTLVERGGYDRYAYEGVASHEEIQAIVARELAAYQAQQAAEQSPEEVVDDAVERRREEEQSDL
jgi:predicted Zn-dependent protease